jgi:hypothetical protein
MGVRRALDAGRLSNEVARSLLDQLERLISEGTNDYDAPNLLLRIDRPRALQLFFSDRIFTSESKSLSTVLQMLNENDVIVPREKLLELIAKLDSAQLDYPQTSQLEKALHLLGKHQNVDDRDTLRKFLSHADKWVREGAASGMMASHGLADLWNRIGKKVKERGWDSLTAPERRYLAVSVFDSQVRNGGLSQYFFNSYGDDWKDALAGLEAIGSQERLAVLREAVAKFSPGGPLTNRDDRMQQLARLANDDDKLFDALDTRYYESTENLSVLLMWYVLKMPEAFR